MTTFEIRFFGAIEITRDGEPLTDFRSQKALALLAYLIGEGRPIARSYLAGLAWPEMPQPQALGLLRRTLHDLTRKLPGCLVVDRRTVQFQADASVFVDLYAFAELVVQDEPTAWMQAVDLYRAPFLEGIYLDDTPELESWLAREQEQWQQKLVSLLDRLIVQQMAEGTYDSALHYARRLVTLEPWREEAHRQVMRLCLSFLRLTASILPPLRPVSRKLGTCLKAAYHPMPMMPHCLSWLFLSDIP